jgi:hypothetical protein
MLYWVRLPGHDADNRPVHSRSPQRQSTELGEGTVAQPTLTPREFAQKWGDNATKEKAASQEHFIDLCRMLGEPTSSIPI